MAQRVVSESFETFESGFPSSIGAPATSPSRWSGRNWNGLPSLLDWRARGRSGETVEQGRPRSVTKRLAHLLPRFVMGVAALVIVLMIGLVSFRLVYGERIYPAVVIGDVPVGGLAPAAAEARLGERVARLEQGIITFTFEDMSWTPTLTELGGSVDLDASLERARTLGREDDALARLRSTSGFIRDDQTVGLAMELDIRRLEAWFDQVNQDLNRPAQDATLVVEGTDVAIAPSEPGLVVDQAAAQQVVMASLRALAPVEAELPTQVAPPTVEAEALESARQQVEAALTEPLTVSFEDQEWTIDPADLGRFVTQSVTGSGHVSPGLDQEALSAWLSGEFAPQIYREPKDAIVDWDGDAEKLVADEPGVDGAILKPRTFAQDLTAAFFNGYTEVPMPVTLTAPAIDEDNLGELGITDLIGEGISNFSHGGGSSRDHNIEVGVEWLNNTLVPPGGEFSFNGAVGAITADKGYVESAVLFGENPGRDIGGGICQVSTTVFRAALDSGFPIGERHAHTYRIYTYELDGMGPGFDASILQLGDDPDRWADFTFENPTDSWLLVTAGMSYPYVYVNIYGPDTGYDVDISETWQNGNSFGFSRTVTDENGNVLPDATEDIGSHYQSW